MKESVQDKKLAAPTRPRGGFQTINHFNENIEYSVLWHRMDLTESTKKVSLKL
jgi:hypothetical protein